MLRPIITASVGLSHHSPVTAANVRKRPAACTVVDLNQHIRDGRELQVRAENRGRSGSEAVSFPPDSCIIQQQELLWEHLLTLWKQLYFNLILCPHQLRGHDVWLCVNYNKKTIR